jgi:hypothetical protein
MKGAMPANSNQVPDPVIDVPVLIASREMDFEKLRCNLRPEKRPVKTLADKQFNPKSCGYYIYSPFRHFLRSLDGQSLKLAVSFQGCGHKRKIGVLVAVITTESVGCDCFRFSFSRDAVVDNLYPAKDPFWASYVLAVCPVSSSLNVGAAEDPEGKIFMTLVSQAHKQSNNSAAA